MIPRKPYTIKCEICGDTFDTVSIKGFAGIMRRHTPKHTIRPINYQVIRSPGTAARAKLKRDPNGPKRKEVVVKPR